MRADIKRLSDLAEKFSQERLTHNPPPVKKLLITHNKKQAAVWCHQCDYGFITFASWQVHHSEVHIKHARNN
jgi:hypothetical protein